MSEILEITFQKKPLREICENELAATNSLGILVATELKSRIADLDAAKQFGDIEAITNHSFQNSKNLTMLIELPDSYKLAVTPNEQNAPELPCGKVDWSKVKRIKILKIERSNV